MFQKLCSLLLIIFSAICLIKPLSAEEIKQTIRGVVIDSESNFPLYGATVAAYNAGGLLVKGAGTDEKGAFAIRDIPVGRYTLVVNYLGYNEQLIPNVVLISARETILEIPLTASAFEMDEVEVRSSVGEFSAINEMTTLSARVFAVEEAERYAGSRGDPARMAANFAGVAGGNDNSNDIVIRGNSPLGVLWRLENVNIPNPNHFGVSGNTGGPVTILNQRLLSNSDFITGAFPAEYGNSIAGVFDLRMRNGNNQNHEFSGQFGFLGTELMAEGPISKGSSSYLVNYRYSTLAIFQALGISIGTDAVPQYQDFSFRLNFPFENNLNLSVFGIGGLSGIDIINSDISSPEDIGIYGDENLDEQFRSGMGVTGLRLSGSPSINTYYTGTLSTSVEYQSNELETIYRRPDTNVIIVDSISLNNAYRFIQQKHSASFNLNHRLNSRNLIRTGIYNDIYQYNFTDSLLNPIENKFYNRVMADGSFALIQPYLQWQFKILENLTLNSGIHGQFLSLNNSYAVEPRVGLRWQFRRGQSLNFGSGLHSQMLPAYIYFADTNPLSEETNMLNKDIDFLRSLHLVAGYDNRISRFLRMRVEAYYQHLYNVPVEKSPSAYSVLNQGDDLNRFFPDELENTGTGRNYGVELTVEKLFNSNYFILFTGTLFDSKYEGSDGNTYNTVFNSNFVMNLLGGWEKSVGTRNRSNIGISGGITFAGGKRHTPLDLELSEQAGTAVFIDSLTNSRQFRNYFRADVRFNYRINTERFTHELGLDLVNVLNNKNVFRQSYTGGNPPLREEYQLGFLPIFYYRIDF
ncbi:MAG: hypothetical protein EA412_02125 [Chitinophagaceae bacterium]|nr:MAG: hypothetical protein EA412_02125 [Chitinophagaceae bacterium]